MSHSDHPICLVDDDLSVLKGLARLLASAGLSATSFSDPATFLRHARSHDVPVALVDIQMPGMTGLQVLDELRTVSPQTRVIIITANEQPNHRSAAFAGGAFAFLSKPLDADLLLDELEKALQAPSIH